MPDFKCMLAGKLDPKKLVFPVIIQPKLDGIRATVVEGKLVSRTLKEIPNRHIFNLLSKPEYEGLDGELIVGSPVAEDCYRSTVSGVMSSDGEPDFAYYIFDTWNLDDGYTGRYRDLCVREERGRRWPDQGVLVDNHWADSNEKLDAIEARLIAEGHEGGIVRGPNSLYKQGRGTATKGDLLKLKRFTDAEAEVIDVVEELHNANEATTNALGRTERSSHKENKIGKGTMGALIVRDIVTGIEFSVGTGFNAQDRADIWDSFLVYPENVVGKIVKYKSFLIGVKEKPRHPVWLGWRSPDDM